LERPPRITMTKAKVSIIIVVLFHVVGLAGFFITSFTPLFLQLVPFHLLLMLVLVIINHYRPDEKFFGFALLIFIAGIAAEWIGVHTRLIFGDYHYGATLGSKLDGIPLTIGVNWFILIYATGVLLKRSRLRNVFARMIAGATLLVLLDLLIEPVAIKFDYWHWAEGTPPLKNYLGWFIVSTAFLGVFELFKFKKQEIVAPVILLIQFVFFGLLLLA
jgi:putative membrane protein